jgi:uncharacterized protein YecE (DUF72 family)
MMRKTAKGSTTGSGHIRAGIGGWTFAPWRGTFYPKGLPQHEELAFAATKLTTIEINATFYRRQSPETYRKWASAVPDGFVFSIKGHQRATHGKDLSDSGETIRWFLGSGVLLLGGKLGPILWQFPPYKRFDESGIAKFLALLPHQIDGRTIRHVVEVRHKSFATPSFIRLLKDFNVAAVFSDSEKYPSIADLTGEVVYARLQRGDDTLPAAYPPGELDRWAGRARLWAAGNSPDDLPLLDAGHEPAPKPRDVFIYFIHEGKLRAPAAAMALIERLG